MNSICAIGFAALHGRLTPEGLVDRSAGYDGDVAALFIPIEARTVDEVSVTLTHTHPQRITLPTGRRNRPVIRGSAEHAIRERLAAETPRK
ncbi:hypothetical protein B5V01_29145 [Mesorhizobium erdmanii]|uniref:Uncharacterized protein n=1 Tax=Mesorhizobium erdmanii TaxID=1777866 RepID=A0A4Q1UNH1_9HYPH|nr:hypothetical protein B5V01_29145 [Mesorhizobium erdmanii]